MALINAEREANRELVKFEPFETTVRRWAVVAAKQLHDGFKMQKIYSGSKNRDYEVWHRNKARTIIEYGKVNGKKVVKRRVKKSSWGWFDENELRKQRKARNPQADYWISTGASMRESDVEVSNLKENIEQFIVEGEVRFRTTMQMYYAEQGVGANGRHQVRGKNGIKVDRSEPFSWRYRYAYDWIPSRGKTHRPSVRQQVHYMSRRMKWLGMKHFNFQLNTWLQVSLADMLDTGTNTIKLPAGLGLSIQNEKQ